MLKILLENVYWSIAYPYSTLFARRVNGQNRPGAQKNNIVTIRPAGK
jgi:hypothetical protein